MMLDFLLGLIGIIILTAYCLIGAFSVPQIAYWTMTPKAIRIMEDSGVGRRMRRKDIAVVVFLTLLAGGLFIAAILFAGKQGADSGMNLWRLSLRFLIFFWMVSNFDAIVLDWWMFSKTDMFGLWLKKQTGKAPKVMRVEPQWDGKEIHKLIGEIVLSVILAWVFLRVHRG